MAKRCLTAATARRRMVERSILTSEGSAACWSSKCGDLVAQNGPAFSSSGRGERKTAGSKTLNGYAPERSGGRVQNGCVSRDAADTHGWRQPVGVCLGSAPAAHTRNSSRLQRVARTGLSIRENAGRAGMLEAATSWVAVAHANAASAKAGTIIKQTQTAFPANLGYAISLRQ